MSSIAARSQLALRLSFFLRRKRASFGVQMQCPLWVKSRHTGRSEQCPLYPQERTLVERIVMSALCQKRTHAPQQLFDARIVGKARWKGPALAKSKYVVAHTTRDHARRRIHYCKGLRSTAAPSRSHSGTGWRSGYVAKCCSKKTAGMNP